MAKRFRVAEALDAILTADTSDEEEDSGSDFNEQEVDNEGDSEDSIQESNDDDDTEVDEVDEDWTAKELHAARFPVFPFTVPNPGFQVMQANRPTTNLGFFALFFTDELFTEIVAQTNDYAKSKLAFRPLHKQSIWKHWYDVTMEEMKAYIGVILNMAINDKPNIQDFFSEDWTTCMPFFKDVFARKRFMQIHWMLHVESITANTGAPRMRADKLRKVLDYVKRKCQELFIPSQNIALDESTIAFKGRVAFKMYNPAKPTKWGLRVYVIADCDTNYICNFEPYLWQRDDRRAPETRSSFHTAHCTATLSGSTRLRTW